jgi:hypothetical protein
MGKRHEHARAIAEALKEELGRGPSIKTVMAWTGASERTVKGWLVPVARLNSIAYNHIID